MSTPHNGNCTGIGKLTDKQFQGLLNRLTLHQKKYRQFLSAAEEEYKNRFGAYPSEVNDDYWVESFHRHTIGAKVEDITANALTLKS